MDSLCHVQTGLISCASLAGQDQHSITNSRCVCRFHQRSYCFASRCGFRSDSRIASAIRSVHRHGNSGSGGDVRFLNGDDIWSNDGSVSVDVCNTESGGGTGDCQLHRIGIDADYIDRLLSNDRGYSQSRRFGFIRFTQL